MQDYTHEYVEILSKLYVFMGREKDEREQGRLRGKNSVLWDMR